MASSTPIVVSDEGEEGADGNNNADGGGVSENADGGKTLIHS